VSSTGSLQIDVLLDPFGASWVDMRDAARLAIDAGFAGIWTHDHLDGRVYDAPYVLECWTVLSALADAAPGVMLGPLVLNVANRHPALLATMAATLQEVSGGRVVLGLGAGGGADRRYAFDQEAIGRAAAPDPARRSQVEAYIADVRRHWRSPGFLKPDPHPPFVVGGFGPKMAELAGGVGDGFNTHAVHPRLRELVARARDAHARSARARQRFLVTVLADVNDRPERAGLEAIGVDRLILSIHAPYDRQRIAEAARVLGM
jgi:alkanesulfonate monooxygenase SsuD/methylene tetrahydromethanopterin reductase-like flavin-dependent oxidoreductase (luciferase family)